MKDIPLGYREIEAPKLSKYWVGCLVVSEGAVSNGLGSMPEGTIYEITSSTTKRSLRSLGCSCCEFKLNFTTGLNKDDFKKKYTFVEKRVVADGEIDLQDVAVTLVTNFPEYRVITHFTGGETIPSTENSIQTGGFDTPASTFVNIPAPLRVGAKYQNKINHKFQFVNSKGTIVETVPCSRHKEFNDDNEYCKERAAFVFSADSDEVIVAVLIDQTDTIRDIDRGMLLFSRPYTIAEMTHLRQEAIDSITGSYKKQQLKMIAREWK